MDKLYLRSIMLFILFILVLSSSGCIHTDFGDPFRTEKPPPPEFEILAKEGFPMQHVFDTASDQDIKFTDARPFFIKEKTKWINITVHVVLNTYNFLNNSPLENYSFIEQYAKITILDPTDDDLFYWEFYETDDIKREVPTPLTGRWAVTVEAVGLGYGNTKDSYEINIIVNEPI